MAEKRRLKHHIVVIEGIDKTGKDLLTRFIHELGGKNYLIQVRGPVSMNAYASLYDRDNYYDITAYKDALHVLLKVDYDDWKIRCKISNEPSIDYIANNLAFERAFKEVIDLGYEHMILNMTRITVYNAAKIIVETLNEMNERADKNDYSNSDV